MDRLREKQHNMVLQYASFTKQRGQRKSCASQALKHSSKDMLMVFVKPAR